MTVDLFATILAFFTQSERIHGWATHGHCIAYPERSILFSSLFIFSLIFLALTVNSTYSLLWSDPIVGACLVTARGRRMFVAIFVTKRRLAKSGNLCVADTWSESIVILILMMRCGVGFLPRTSFILSLSKFCLFLGTQILGTCASDRVRLCIRVLSKLAHASLMWSFLAFFARTLQFNCGSNKSRSGWIFAFFKITIL